MGYVPLPQHMGELIPHKKVEIMGGDKYRLQGDSAATKVQVTIHPTCLRKPDPRPEFPHGGSGWHCQCSQHIYFTRPLYYSELIGHSTFQAVVHHP